MRLTAVLLIALLPACASRVAPPPTPPGADAAPERRALAPIDAQEAGPLFEKSFKSFARAFEADAELFGAGGGAAGKVTGCVAGVVGLSFLVAGTGGHLDGSGDASGPIFAFCYLGGGAGYVVGYGIGYGLGAVVGTVHGSVEFVSDGIADAISAALGKSGRGTAATLAQ
jgi:hypothetical protein